MSDAEERSLHQRLDKQDVVLGRLDRAIRGDEDTGHEGLVKRVRNHSERIRKLERNVLYLTGAAGALAIVWRIVEVFIK